MLIPTDKIKGMRLNTLPDDVFITIYKIIFADSLKCINNIIKYYDSGTNKLMLFVAINYKINYEKRLKFLSFLAE